MTKIFQKSADGSHCLGLCKELKQFQGIQKESC